MKKTLVLGIFSIAYAAGTSSNAGADTFVRADEHAARSLAQGLGVAHLPLLQRQAGDPEATIASLLPRLCRGDCSSIVRQPRRDRARVRGANWHLDVFGDGSMVEFVDEAAAARARSLAVDAAGAISRASLESAGRAYIEEVLAGSISLGAGEAIVPESWAARAEGGVGRDGVMAPAMVTGNRVVFTREINGIPVMGNGSKIAITFLNDGSVESFRYDWPTYVPTGQTQQMAAVTDIRQRVQHVVRLRTAYGNAGAAPAPLAAPISGDLGPNTRLERFSCGYYDAGVSVRDPQSPVQAGCFYHAVHTIGSGAELMTAGFSGAVPAAVRVEVDHSWPEVALLPEVTRGGGADPGAARPPGASGTPAP